MGKPSSFKGHRSSIIKRQLIVLRNMLDTAIGCKGLSDSWHDVGDLYSHTSRKLLPLVSSGKTLQNQRSTRHDDLGCYRAAECYVASRPTPYHQDR